MAWSGGCHGGRVAGTSMAGCMNLGRCHTSSCWLFVVLTIASQLPLIPAISEFGDPNQYTCLLPMRPDESLAESLVWNAALGEAQHTLTPRLQSSQTDLTSKVQIVEQLQSHTEQGEKHVHPGADTSDSTDSQSSSPSPSPDNPFQLALVMKLISEEAAAECAKGSNIPPSVISATQDLLSAKVPKAVPAYVNFSNLQQQGLLDKPVLNSQQATQVGAHLTALLDTDLVKSMQNSVARRRMQEEKVLLNEGKPCWEACGQRSGNCSSGFCGRGVCCKRLGIDPDCPLGLSGGCMDGHCCIDRLTVSESKAKDLSCNAQAGSYCLSSMLVGQRMSLNAFEICALTRTVSSCPPGFYCKGGESAPRACGRGKRCPQGSKEALACPPGFFCPLSIISRKCPPGMGCGWETVMPGPCEGGYYCPDGVQIRCPLGHFCPPGSWKPEVCALTAYCPEGSELQSFKKLACWSLLVGLLSWGAALKAVPRWLHTEGGIAGTLPTIVLLVCLSVAWVVKLDLFYVAAKQFDAVDPSQLTMQRIFGNSPHSTALVFLTLAYTFLLYGLLVSVRIRNAKLRSMVDSVICPVICLVFNAHLQDWSAVLFVFNLWAAFRVIWPLMTQQGSWSLRVGLLGAGLLALVCGFLWLGDLALAQLLGCTLLGSVVKEFLIRAFPRMRLAIRKRKVEGMLSDAPLQPLIDYLVMEPLQVENPEAHPATAARVAASARACLVEHKTIGSVPADSGGCCSPVDSEACAAWVSYYRRHLGDEHTSFDAKRIQDGKGVSFDLRDVSYRLDSNRKLLQNITFTVPGGMSIAVMGASGSGKTTLLSVLSGRCGDGHFMGEMRLNDTPMLPWQMAQLRPLIGYVPQDDVMHSMLTVRENIEFQAELRLRQDTAVKNVVRQFDSELGLSRLREEPLGGDDCAKRQEFNAQIDAVIGGLGLAHVSNRPINTGLSGGQRKRVSIGMEVVTQPRVLLLDEPSSGLDSSTAHRILELVLKGAREKMCTTFSTIHQPRWTTLTLFDMLVLLAPGGHLCFAGPVIALKAYFREVLHVDFPMDENPADVILDACTFESARKMSMEGIWKHPPQCLRSLLFPTPEVVNEDFRSHWQQEEFGRILGELWKSFAAKNISMFGNKETTEGLAEGRVSSKFQLHPQARQLTLQPVELDSDQEQLRPSSAEQCLTDKGNSLGREARARTEQIHWAQQVWLHVARTLLIMSRVLWPTILTNVFLLMVSMAALAWAFPNLQLEHVFLPSSLMFLLLCLAQSVAAQRIFGGEDRQMTHREAGVCSLGQIVFGFIGKDLASLVEIVLAAMCFTLTYWPQSASFVHGSDLFAIGFATLYCIWGLNHIWAIAFSPHSAMLLAVIVSFLSFLFCGLKPEAHVLAKSLGGYGSLLLLVSPVRWSMSHWIFRHLTGNGSTYFGEAITDKVHWLFSQRGFKLDNLQCPNFQRRVLERWVSGEGLVCHSGQLFLLGFLFRFIAVMCLLVSSSSKASGGRLPLGTSSSLRSRMLRDAIMVFLAFFVVLQIVLLGQTY